MNSSIATDSPSALQSCRLSTNLTQKVAKIIAYSLIALVGLLGNSLICFIFWKNKNLRRTVNYFIFNMAVSDLLVPVFAIPRRINKVLSLGQWFIVGWAGTVLCKLSYFAQDVSLVVSILSLLFMAFETFIAIVFPMRTSAIMSTRLRVVLIALTWITSVAVHVPYFYTFRLIKSQKNITICKLTWEPAIQRRYGIATFTVFVVVPFVLLVYFYTSIAIAIRKQTTSLDSSTRAGINTERARRDRENRSVTTLSAVVVGGYVVCCLPMNAFVFFQIFGFHNTTPNCSFSITFYFIADFFVRSTSIVNPCTCFVFYQSYRRALGEIFHSFSQAISKACRNRREETLPSSLIELRAQAGEHKLDCEFISSRTRLSKLPNGIERERSSRANNMLL